MNIKDSPNFYILLTGTFPNYCCLFVYNIEKTFDGFDLFKKLFQILTKLNHGFFCYNINKRFFLPFYNFSINIVIRFLYIFFIPWIRFWKMFSFARTLFLGLSPQIGKELRSTTENFLFLMRKIENLGIIKAFLTKLSKGVFIAKVNEPFNWLLIPNFGALTVCML